MIRVSKCRAAGIRACKYEYKYRTIFMLDDTIRANVTFGVATEVIDDDQVWKYLEHHFVEVDKWDIHFVLLKIDAYKLSKIHKICCVDALREYMVEAVPENT